MVYILEDVCVWYRQLNRHTSRVHSHVCLPDSDEGSNGSTGSAASTSSSQLHCRFTAAHNTSLFIASCLVACWKRGYPSTILSSQMSLLNIRVCVQILTACWAAYTLVCQKHTGLIEGIITWLEHRTVGWEVDGLSVVLGDTRNFMPRYVSWISIAILLLNSIVHTINLISCFCYSYSTNIVVAVVVVIVVAAVVVIVLEVVVVLVVVLLCNTLSLCD